MKKLFELAVAAIYVLCKDYNGTILKHDAGSLFKKWSDDIRSIIGEEEADAFLVAAASGTLSEDRVRETVDFYFDEDRLEQNYTALMDGEPLYMAVEETDQTIEYDLNDYAQIEEEKEVYRSALKNDSRLETSDEWHFQDASWVWKSVKREDEKKERKRERKIKLRSLVDEIGDARTGDERFDTLAAIVREMIQEEDGDGYEDYDDYDDDYDDDDYEDYDEDYDEE